MYDETTYSYADHFKYGYQRVAVGHGSTFAPTAVGKSDIRIIRDHAATVPSLSGSAGISCSLGRVAVKAGYSWERYFNAIEGGNASGAKSYDRTIQGPYIKLSLGLGR